MPTIKTWVGDRGNDDEVINIVVSYTLFRAYKGKTDGRYGPKLEPDEPAHIEIDGVVDSQGGVIVLTIREERQIIEEICELEAEKLV